MDARTRSDDLEEAINTAIEGKLAHLNTATPCKVVSVDFAKQTCVLQPVVKARVRMQDGTQQWVQRPQIPDVPLHFPHGGGVTITFAVKAGDEALAVFGSESHDLWQQQGGEQNQIDTRSHDMSNGFAMVGFKSNPNALSNVSSTSTQVRSDDGKHVIDIHPTNGLSMTSSQAINMSVAGVSMAMTSDGIKFTSPTITNNDHAIDHTHLHTGVSPGASTTGPPV